MLLWMEPNNLSQEPFHRECFYVTGTLFFSGEHWLVTKKSQKSANDKLSHINGDHRFLELFSSSFGSPSYPVSFIFYVMLVSRWRQIPGSLALSPSVIFHGHMLPQVHSSLERPCDDGTCMSSSLKLSCKIPFLLFLVTAVMMADSIPHFHILSLFSSFLRISRFLLSYSFGGDPVMTSDANSMTNDKDSFISALVHCQPFPRNSLMMAVIYRILIVVRWLVHILAVYQRRLRPSH